MPPSDLHTSIVSSDCITQDHRIFISKYYYSGVSIGLQQTDFDPSVFIEDQVSPTHAPVSNPMQKEDAVFNSVLFVCATCLPWRPLFALPWSFLSHPGPFLRVFIPLAPSGIVSVETSLTDWAYARLPWLNLGPSPWDLGIVTISITAAPTAGAAAPGPALRLLPAPVCCTS